MIRRIDLFLPPYSQYSVLHHFTYKFYEALTRVGISCRILEAKFYDPKPFLQQIFNDPPDCTLSFNGLLPDENGYFFSDLVQIPHVACLTDPPTRFIELVKSPMTIITCMDRSGLDFFKELHFEKAFFMPHGVEKNIKGDPEQPRNIDVLLLSTCIDYEQIRAEWRNKYSTALCKVLDEAAERTLADQTTSYINAFVASIDHHLRTEKDLDPNTIPYIEALMDLDDYIRGKDRVDLLRSIKDFPVDIYGSGPWEKFTKNTKGRVHTPTPYEHALTLMKNSKIILNTSATTKNGAHTRVFAGLLSGAVPITNENPYMLEYFKDFEDVVYYRHSQAERVNENIGKILSDNTLKASIVHHGREKTLAHHTWDHRASQLIKNLTPILNQMKEYSH